jgi:hypothetical protein
MQEEAVLGQSPVEVEPLSSRGWNVALVVRRRRPRVIVDDVDLSLPHTEGHHLEAAWRWRVHPTVGAHAGEGLKTASPARFPIFAVGGSSADNFTRSTAAALIRWCNAKKKGKERVIELGFQRMKSS